MKHCVLSRTAILLLGFLFLSNLQLQAKDILSACWDKQVEPLHGQYLTFSFKETKNVLVHGFEPWQHITDKTQGTVSINANDFLKLDTLATEKKTYISKTQLSKTDFLFQDFGDTSLSPVTKSDFAEQPFAIARYSPAILINYFYEHRSDATQETSGDFTVYTLWINKNLVKLYIGAADSLLQKVTHLENNDLYGDALSTLSYTDYANIGDLHFPKTVFIDKISGHLKDEVDISTANIVKEVPALLTKPADFTWAEEPIKHESSETVVLTRPNGLHFFQLNNTDSQIMVVEFSNFILVEGAPLSTKNGDAVLRIAQDFAPNKPVKYFTFGHFHPDYLGGVRAFIYNGTTILTTAADTEYLQYLATAPHTLKPDALQLDPKPLHTQIVTDSATISDGKFEMKMYVIGKKSAHTDDYTIYYFPSEHLLFEDDLVWIKKDGPLEKAGKRQAGLYNAIKDLHLDVATIMQSWPQKNYGVKSVISFSELEQSVNMK